MSFTLFLAALAQPIPQLLPTPAMPLPPETEAVDDDATAAADDIVASDADFYNRLTVPVMIGEEGPFRFLVDTGAQATALTERLRDRLALETIGTATVVGMASKTPVELVAVDDLRFAARAFNNIEAPLLRARNIGADGILGLDSLQTLRVVIDFRNDTIAVNDAEALGGNSGFDIVIRARRRLGRLIITQAKVDGITTDIIVDTGAHGSVGNLALRKRMRSRGTAPYSTTDVNGVELLGTLNIARTLRIQSMEIRDLPIGFADAPPFEVLGLRDRPALILGMRDLRLFNRVAIDFASRKVLFDVPRASRQQRLSSQVLSHLAQRHHIVANATCQTFPQADSRGVTATPVMPLARTVSANASELRPLLKVSTCGSCQI